VTALTERLHGAEVQEARVVRSGDGSDVIDLIGEGGPAGCLAEAAEWFDAELNRAEPAPSPRAISPCRRIRPPGIAVVLADGTPPDDEPAAA
jgi:hypothetical protein